jgi:hypothetical protein
MYGYILKICEILQILLVIVTHIWQKLSSVERKETLIVTNFWQLFSRIFGETSLIVTNIWRNHTRFLCKENLLN